MEQGFDCSTPLTQHSVAFKFANQGNSFVGRYLADVGAGKRLSISEAKVISDAGLYIVSFFERYANRAGGGAAAGSEDGKLALQWAREVNQPEGTAIYAAVDYDAPSRDFDVIEAYMRAFDKEIDGYELGVYGSYSVVKAMFERGVATKLMQTYAWSNGRIFDKNSIYQYKNDIIVNGIGVDLNTSNGDAGGWNLNMLNAQTVSLPENIANNIIDSYLGKAWRDCEDERVLAEKEGRTVDAASWLQLREWQHTLANALRKSSGQAEQ